MRRPRAHIAPVHGASPNFQGIRFSDGHDRKNNVVLSATLYPEADCHFSHGMQTRSAKMTMPYSKNPSIDKLNSETNDIEVRSSVLAMMMRWPSPSLPPTNSPMTAPITERVLATFRLLKRYGSAFGSLTLENSCHRPECRMRQRSSNSSSIATSPVTMLTTIGKNETSSASSTFDVSP